MKTKVSLSLFVVLGSLEGNMILNDENDLLPTVDLLDNDGNLINTPEDGVNILINKFFKIDSDYVKKNISGTYINHNDGSINIYHKIILIKSSVFFGNTVKYVSLKDKIEDERYYELFKYFKLSG